MRTEQFLWIALFALAFTALCLAFSWYVSGRDRHRLRVISRFNFNPGRRWGSQAFLRVTVQNNSRKPMTISKVRVVFAGKICGERFFDGHRGAPVRVVAGEEVSTVVEKNDHTIPLPEATDFSRSKVFVTDALGKVYGATYINESNYF